MQHHKFLKADTVYIHGPFSMNYLKKKLKYPTKREEENHLQDSLVGDMLVPWRVILLLLSQVVSPHLWNTPLNLYQQAMKGFLS